MRCAQVDRRVEQFVDGALEIPLVRQIERHLQSCTRCSARVDAARALLKGLGAPIERAPPGFAARVMDAVYREALSQSRETRPARLPAQRGYRRLGLSFVLTAGILAASLFVPRISYPGLLGTGSAAVVPSRESDAAVLRGFGRRGIAADLDAAVQSALNGADSVVRGILREQGNGGSVR
jgi:anti-sigma factor RsiW